MVAILGCAQWGCQSDAAAICEKLESCNLLPKDDEDPKKSLTETRCESQLENELGDADQERCADCVDSHSCEEIQSECRKVCNPPY